MATMTKDVTDGIESLITGVGDQSNAAIDSIQNFVQAVNAAIPGVGGEAVRTQIIESAFAMTHQVVDASNKFAVGLVGSTGRTVQGAAKSGSKAKS